MKKVIAIISVVVILAVALTIAFIVDSNLKYEIEEVSEYNYFKLLKDNKYGVINKNGEALIDPEYEVVYIPNPEKAIFVCYYDYNSQTGEYTTKVLNENNEELFTQYEKVEAFVFEDISTSQIPFEKSVLKYKKDGKYGLINFEGKELTKPIYDSIKTVSYKEGCFVVEQDGKFGVINLKGNMIIKSEYDKITADGYYNSETKSYNAGFIVGNKTEEGYRYGYIDTKGKVLLKTEYNEINRVTEIINDKEIYLVVFKNGKAGLMKNQKYILNHDYEEIEYNKTNELFALQKNSKQGIVDKEGNQIVPIEYDSIMFSGENINVVKDDKIEILNKKGEKIEQDGTYKGIIQTENENYLITINTDNKYGVKNKEGNIIIKNNYQYIEYAFDKYFIVTNNGKVGVLNDEGKAEIDFIYDIIQKMSNKKALQAINSANNTTDIIDQNIKVTVSMESAILYTEDEYIKVLSDTQRIYTDNNGKIITNKDIFKNNTLFASSKDGKWGFADVNGNEVVEYKYDMVTEFNNYGYAGIKLNDVWGVVNTQGEIIVEPSYKIDWKEPEFISKYCRLNFGYGFEYYTDDLTK